jgi:hypothetical protein
MFRTRHVREPEVEIGLGRKGVWHFLLRIVSMLRAVWLYGPPAQRGGGGGRMDGCLCQAVEPGPGASSKNRALEKIERGGPRNSKLT